MAEAPVLRSLVETVLATVDAAPDTAGFALRNSRRALDALRAGSKTRLGARLLATSDRLLDASDRVLTAGKHSRAYVAAEKLVVQGAATVQESRAKTRARYQRLRSSLARLPAQAHTDLRVYCAARRERLMAFSRDSRLSLEARLARCSALLDAQVNNSKTLRFLTAKARALLVLARLLPAEGAAEVPRLITAERAKRAPQRAVAPPAEPRTFTSYSAVTTVTPSTLISTLAGGDISPAMLDTLRRNTAASPRSPDETTNPAPAAPSADHVANPAAAAEAAAPSAFAFNAEGRGGLWMPIDSPAKVRTDALSPHVCAVRVAAREDARMRPCPRERTPLMCACCAGRPSPLWRRASAP